jgi:hypothetical protein
MKRFVLAALAASLLVVAAPAAFAASIDIGQAINGSLQEIINGVVTALIAGLVGWVAIVVKNKFNIDIEAKHREAITAFVQRQASSLIAMGAVKLDGVKVEVQNAALADAANKALAAIPDALAFFGITPASIQQRIIDMLPKEPAVAAAQAVAIDVANPATPKHRRSCRRLSHAVDHRGLGRKGGRRACARRSRQTRARCLELLSGQSSATAGGRRRGRQQDQGGNGGDKRCDGSCFSSFRRQCC